jgi:hypothetical protein
MANILTPQNKVPRVLSMFQIYKYRVEAGDVVIKLELAILLEANKQKHPFADIIRHCQ